MRTECEHCGKVILLYDNGKGQYYWAHLQGKFITCLLNNGTYATPKFSDDELFKGNDIMDEYAGEFDDDFWEKENYIMPTIEMIKQVNAQKKRTSVVD